MTTRREGGASFSSTTRYVHAGGRDGGTVDDTIDYVTISSTGNSSDFGNLSEVKVFLDGLSSSTRGVFGGGNNGQASKNEMQYITIASTGNTTDFGDLTATARAFSDSSFSSDTIGFFMFASGQLQNRITIASTGNAVTAFSNLGDSDFSPYSEYAGVTSTHGGIG